MLPQHKALILLFSFLLITHTSTSLFYSFYLNQTQILTEVVPEARSCDSENNPCNSYCEIVNYVNNNITNELYITIEIYFLSDYYFSSADTCEFTTKKTMLVDFKRRENSSQVVSLNFEIPVHFSVNIEVLFHSLTLNFFVFYCNKITFDSCTLINLMKLKISASITDTDSITITNSTINNSKIDNVSKLSIQNSNFFGQFSTTSVERITIENCKFFGVFDISNSMSLRMTVVEFNNLSTFAVSYVGSMTMSEIIFNNVDGLESLLTIKFCPNVYIFNCESLTKHKFALLTGSNYVFMKNVFTAGSIEILYTNTVEIHNSQFVDSEYIGLRVMDINKLNLFNVNFTKCNLPLVIENINTPNLLAIITSSNFKENKAVNGAGFILTSPAVSLEINNTKFISNEANLSGGAVFVKSVHSSESTVTINNCEFIGNSAGLVSQPKRNMLDGNGGALFIVGATSLSSDTNFKDNTALRGGAIYTDSLITKTSGASFMNNVGKISGNTLFSNNLETIQNINNVIKNNAEISSYIYKTKLLFNVENERVKTIRLFSSQTFTVVVQGYDMVGNRVPQIYEPFELIENSNQGFKLFETSNSNNGEYKFLFIQSANYTLETKEVKDNFSMVFPNTQVTIDFTVIDCPSGWENVKRENYNYCERIEFPISVVIVLSLLGAILFFLIGIGVGILIIYLFIRIMIKLKRLEKKEKAELEIERKIIDKKIVFGDSSDIDIPLLGADMDEKKIEKKANRDEKFIIPVEEIVLESKIGEGGCGTVYSAKWGDNIVAIKTIRVSDASEEEEEDFEREVSLLSSLRHPNIVTFYGVTITDKSKYMVIEYLSKGSLKQAIYYSKIGKEVLCLQKKLNILIGISQGMNYLHNLKPNAIIHRDLKPENVLLDSNGVCKVCDFGLSKIIGTATQTMTTNVGTLFYLSPEMLKGDNPSTITSKLDVYSFAIIMWELFFEESPYHNSSSNKINYFNHSNELSSSNDNIFLIPSLVAKGLRPTIPFTTEDEKEIWMNEFIIPFESNSFNNKQVFNIVDNYLQLMKECWSQDPNERPFFSEILIRLQEMKNFN